MDTIIRFALVGSVIIGIVVMIVTIPTFYDAFTDLTSYCEGLIDSLEPYWDYCESYLITGRELINWFLPATAVNVMLICSVFKTPIAYVIAQVKAAVIAIL